MAKKKSKPSRLVSNCLGHLLKRRRRKQKIPLALKQAVWINYFGEVYKHKCIVEWCSRVVSCFDFEVGHNKPESKGGTTTLDNLKPICRQCNIGMGNRYTIDEWSCLVEKPNASKNTA